MKMAGESAGKVILCFCRAHVGRYFIDCAASHPHLEPWREKYPDLIGGIYRLYRERLKYYVAGCRSSDFERVQSKLEDAVGGLFTEAESELEGPAEDEVAAPADSASRGG